MSTNVPGQADALERGTQQIMTGMLYECLADRHLVALLILGWLRVLERVEEKGVSTPDLLEFRAEAQVDGTVPDLAIWVQERSDH